MVWLRAATPPRPMRDRNTMTSLPPLLAALRRHELSRIETAYHEAAHAVAGVLHGGRLTAATITEGKRKGATFSSPSGLTTFASLPSTRHAPVSYAGVWGQARARAGGRRPGRRELFAVLESTGCKDREVLTAAGGPDAGESVVPLLETCWPSVAELAAKLHRHGKVSHSDVLAALRLSDDAGTRSIELSMIRSGAAPGSFSVSRPG